MVETTRKREGLKVDNTEQPDIFALFKQVSKANQELTESYFNNLPNLIHSGRDMANVFFSYTNRITTHPDEMVKIQGAYFDFLQKQMELFKSIYERKPGEEYKPVITPSHHDKRFKAPEWNPGMPNYFEIIKQSYLLISQLMLGVVEHVELDELSKKKLKFYMEQYLDALSPANFIATNPEVLAQIERTNGQCLIDGFKNFATDIENGRISQTDKRAFKVGENLATTKGAVVYENDMMQLIQYAPATKQIKEIPLLLIPPWINRYYILDLEPENSMVRYLVEQGFTVFMISWCVPKESNGLGHLRFDDYADQGVITALNVIKQITKAKKVNAFGYCIGGTLLGVVLAILAAKKKNSIASATFLATMLDFSDIGSLSVLVDEPLVKKLEQDLKDGKVLKGKDMTNAFNIIRANDLIWPYVVNNYLKGKTPTPFSVLYWTNDNTNLPGNMYTYYLRNFIIENKLAKKNALTICETPIDLSKVNVPAFAVGLREDHISPCRTTYKTTHLLSGETEFVLGEAGHTVGAINPPYKHKYGFMVNGNKKAGYEEWQKTAQHREGSWWTYWVEWLSGKSGKMISAPSKLGSKEYPVIEDAPGRYVTEPIE